MATATAASLLLSPRRETAELLGCSPETVTNLIKAGSLRAVRLGKAVRVPRQELENLIARGQANTKAA
jgi:excisionase family DNA binding protein